MEDELRFDGEHLAREFRHFQLLFVAIKAGIPAVLAKEPRTLTEISNALGLAAPRLQRVLRGLIWCQAITTEASGAYLLTKAGRALLDEGPRSLTSHLRFQGEFFFNAWGHLWDYLESGETPFKSAHGGATLFEMLETNEALATLFGAPMTAHSAEQARQIAAHPAFASQESLLIVDIGGGEGRLLVSLLRAYPSACGVLLEMPVLQAATTKLIAEEDVADRCKFVPGDMFAAVPENGDIYLLKWVLHDWNDADAIRILQRCAAAMRPESKDDIGARLLIVERLMPDVVDAANAGLVQADLNMLCQMGGAERTLAEYEGLLTRASLRLLSMRQIDDVYGFVVLECSRG